MDIALKELKKFRDGSAKEVERVKNKIQLHKEAVVDFEKLLAKEEQKVKEYDQIIEMVGEVNESL